MDSDTCTTSIQNLIPSSKLFETYLRNFQKEHHKKTTLMCILEHNIEFSCNFKEFYIGKT